MDFYRKKPVVIAAIQFWEDNFEEVRMFCPYVEGLFHDMERGDAYLVIPTLEGPLHAAEGDYIIRGVAGEFYPCKPDIFNQTYDPVVRETCPSKIVTDDPQDNTQTAYNLYYIKDFEVYLRGYGDDPADPDVSLFKFIRKLVGEHIPDAELPASDMDLSFMLSEWLMFDSDSAEGVLALLYTSAWAFAELRERLGTFEKIGATPMELADNKAFVDEWIRGNDMSFKQVADLISLHKAGGIPLSPVKVGDMLWPICWDKVPKKWIVDTEPTRVNEVGTMGFFVSATYGDPEGIDEFHPFEEISDEYFFSHEEAVAAAAVKEIPEEDET